MVGNEHTGPPLNKIASTRFDVIRVELGWDHHETGRVDVACFSPDDDAKQGVELLGSLPHIGRLARLHGNAACIQIRKTAIDAKRVRIDTAAPLS